MVQYDTNSDTDWIVNGELGHAIWESINSSTYVRFTDGIAILAKLIKFGEDTNLVRINGEDIEGPQDWAEPFSLMKPEMRMGFNFNFQLEYESPKEVKMAIYGRTIHGANFVHEFTQEKGEQAEAIIRAPVPDSMREEALGIEDDYENAEMVREQAGAFQDRFNVTDESPPSTYWEPHIKLTNVESRREILEVFMDVLDIVEKGVRSTR